MSRHVLHIWNESDRDRVRYYVAQAPAGTRVEFKAMKRSGNQNSAFWAALTDIAAQAQHNGRKYTPDEWKILFLHAIGQEVKFMPGLDGKTVVPWGQSSSDLSKAEMTALIDFIHAWGAERGVTFHDGQEAAA